MWVTVLIGVIFVVSVGTIGFLLWKKLPQIRIVDPKTNPESPSKKLKSDIMRKRVERAGGENWRRFQKKVLVPAGKNAQLFIRRFAGKLTAAERRFQEEARKESGEKMNSEMKKKAIAEAQKFMNEELWDRAEKLLIQVISEDPKYVHAYEQLGRLYLMQKKFDQSLETFQFLSKLEPNDASVIAYLGQSEQQLKNPEKALKHFKKAVELSPKNPKYLDLLIASAIENGDRLLAMSTVDKLKEVNPENQKIEQFEKEIEETKIKIK